MKRKLTLFIDFTLRFTVFALICHITDNIHRRPDFVAILGILSRAEIEDLAQRSYILRSERRSRRNAANTSNANSNVAPPMPPRPPAQHRDASPPSSPLSNSSSGTERDYASDSDTSKESSRRYVRRNNSTRDTRGRADAVPIPRPQTRFSSTPQGRMASGGAGTGSHLAPPSTEWGGYSYQPPLSSSWGPSPTALPGYYGGNNTGPADLRHSFESNPRPGSFAGSPNPNLGAPNLAPHEVAGRRRSDMDRYGHSGHGEMVGNHVRFADPRDSRDSRPLDLREPRASGSRYGDGRDGRSRDDRKGDRDREREKEKEKGKRWREHVTAAGIGGAAASLISVLSEAAADLDF
jgi:hypothetical protein